MSPKEMRDSIDQWFKGKADELINSLWKVAPNVGSSEGTENLGISEGITAVVTRNITDEPSDPGDDPKDTPTTPIEDIDIFLDTPLAPLTDDYGISSSEAFQAKDKIEVDLGKRNETYIQYGRVYQLIISNGKKHYLSKGRVMHPCEVLENTDGGFDINKRKHVATGNSSARLRQIRRHYAYINCK